MSGSQSTADDTAPQPVFMQTWFFAAAGGGVLLCCAVSCICCMRRARRRRRRDATKASVMELHAISGEGAEGVEIAADSRGRQPDQDRPEIPPDTDPPFRVPVHDVRALMKDIAALQIDRVEWSQIQPLESIGSGSFGEVRRALRNKKGTKPGAHGVGTEVALKEGLAVTENSPENEAMKIKLLREIVTMGQFAHNNVLSIIAIVQSPTKKDCPIAVHEYMASGTLDRWLRKARPNLTIQLQLARQVVSGVYYLARREFVIGTLSAKTVMLGKDLNAKIADFGVSRDIVDPIYPLSKGAVPWCGPELFRDSDFKGDARWRRSGDSGVGTKSLASSQEDPRRLTPATVIWALGVTIWEIFGCAEHAPFQKYPAPKIAQKVKDGVRLAPPPGCPREIYALMMRCWHPVALSRPPIKAVHEEMPLRLPRPVSSANMDYPELQKVYVGTDFEVAEVGTERRSSTERAPSPLIPLSLVGLKKDVDESRGAVQSAVGNLGTISSRPSNYTSGTGSSRNTRSSASLTSYHNDDRDDDRGRRSRPSFTSIFDAESPGDQGDKGAPEPLVALQRRRGGHTHSPDSDSAGPTVVYQAPSGFAAPPTSSRFSWDAVDSMQRRNSKESVESAGYMMIMPHSTTSPSMAHDVRGSSPAQKSKSVNADTETRAMSKSKRKSALALALLGAGIEPPLVDADAPVDVGMAASPSSPMPGAMPLPIGGSTDDPDEEDSSSVGTTSKQSASDERDTASPDGGSRDQVAFSPQPSGGKKKGTGWFGRGSKRSKSESTLKAASSPVPGFFPEPDVVELRSSNATSTSTRPASTDEQASAVRAASMASRPVASKRFSMPINLSPSSPFQLTRAASGRILKSKVDEDGTPERPPSVEPGYLPGMGVHL